MTNKITREERHGLPADFCIMPWMHLNVNPLGDVLQCCISSSNGEVGHLRDNTLAEIWNGDPMRDLRLRLLNGGKPASCHKCFEQEANGIPSFRQGINQRYEHHLDSVTTVTNSDGSVDEMTLRYWDFRFSNLCNMKCRMCCHDFSSAWHADMIKLDGPTSVPADAVVNVTDTSIDDIHRVLDEQIDNVEEIYFAGGEPLLMDEHYYILEKLIARGRRDVRLRYNSNLLKIKHKHWDNIELWRNFDSVTVFASLDAMGPRAEYLRHGTVWSTIDENIRRLIAEPAVNFFVAPTIQVLNLLHIPDLIDYLLDCGMSLYNIRINNVLTTPPYFHINTLSPAYKQLARSRFLAHVAQQSDPHMAADLQQQYLGILSYMEADPQMTDEHMANIKRGLHRNIFKLDAIRGESFAAVFPELSDHIEQAVQQIRFDQQHQQEISARDIKW
jgi:MoaA/NifB/PqqE/SkfB family radical SAM enzyme